MYVLRHWTIIFLPNISLEWKKDSYHINNERWLIFKKWAESARSGQLKSLTERPMENMRVACVEHCKHARVPRGRQLHVYHIGKFPQACLKKTRKKVVHVFSTRPITDCLQYKNTRVCGMPLDLILCISITTIITIIFHTQFYISVIMPNMYWPRMFRHIFRHNDRS